ncbi:hypothetical protein H9Y04_01150 [Streptomyces sp. TRM66268-LWL]|uniref:Tetratricopeptide repeat protein n=1 Tax=Streptomyces polyasparticus TaxID=2767826 RepID=A0ABR7S866_9ACTN|nr:tetratricopeptide repeat protein [Streptomyces polyasparticus]MBC9711179.1 hypothetical protein [Streptomyces polyasparticus]
MDAADLDHRARTQSGCIPPDLVSRLLAFGHAATVEAWARRGEWFCAREWARLLGERDRQADALEVLAPYVETGWWTAVRSTAELLESWGRADEAIALSRARMEAGHPMALEFHARLLARHGRGDEAFDLARPCIDDWSVATALVDVAESAGRDEEAAELLAARIPADHRCDSPWCCRGLDADTAISLLATVRERQGRVDEAVTLLRTRSITSVNGRDQLADLLARHDRIEELRAYAASETLGDALRCLAEVLERRGDIEGAISAYRKQGDCSSAHGPDIAYALAQLLARHGRGDEAIDVMRAQAETYNGDDWILHALAGLYLAQGRAEEGLTHLDALAGARKGKEEWDLYWIRLPLMAACYGTDEAVARARSHPEAGTAYAAEPIAELYADAGRIEEAVAVLESQAAVHRRPLAGYLIELGRVEDAVTVLKAPVANPPVQWGAPGHHDEPPF